jgi:hypothetical protein
MPLTDHPAGGYRFLPGIAPYSCGVVSQVGFEIVQVTLQQPVAYRYGFERIADWLDNERRPKAALCAISLRSPRPYSFAEFAAFNAEYAEVLQDWKLLVDGVNPVARTNVAPVVRPPDEPMLYGFSYTRPCASEPLATFVVAGAGELPEGRLSRDDIVSLGDTSPAGLVAKARCVMELMTNRLRGLGVDWSRVNTANVYTAHALLPVLRYVVLEPMGAAAWHGVRWHYSRPPVEEIEYEMDLRGTRNDFYLV